MISVNETNTRNDECKKLVEHYRSGSVGFYKGILNVELTEFQKDIINKLTDKNARTINLLYRSRTKSLTYFDEASDFSFYNTLKDGIKLNNTTHQQKTPLWKRIFNYFKPPRFSGGVTVPFHSEEYNDIV